MIQKLKNQLSTPIGHALVSKRSDDAYIVAFPRSGSTWLRTMLVNVIDSNAKSNPDVFNARMPAVSIRNAKFINALESPRLIMTHSVFRPSIDKAVYLVRDGRDAFISSFHYHVTRNGEKISLDEYLQRYQDKYYGHTWEKHVESWLVKGRDKLSQNLLVVKFEELKRDPNKKLKEVIEFLKIDADEHLIQQAIDDSSIDNAKKIELQRQGLVSDDNASFYRGGHSHQWQEPVYLDVVEVFSEKANRALKLAGYLI